MIILFNRIKKYLDLRHHKEKQEDHDDRVLKRREKGKDYQYQNCTRNYKDITELKEKALKAEVNNKITNDNIHRLATFVGATNTPSSSRHASATTSTRLALT